MTEEILIKDLQQLAGHAYKKQFQIPKSWIEIDDYNERVTGLYVSTFIKNDNIVISFRGTDKNSKRDILNDIIMASNMLPPQIISAQKYYDKIKNKFPDKEIILTGHSLGGSLAQIIGSQTGDKTVTFSAYGTGSFVNSQIKTDKNITNYGNIEDPIFTANIKNQIGKTMIISDNFPNNSKCQISKGLNNIKYNPEKHYLENIGNLNKGVEYKGQKLPIENNLLIKINIEKNINARDIDKKRVITREEIAKMSKDEFERNENFINQQLKLGNIMSKAQADEKIKTGDLIWVNSYTRDDGTKVCGYYRRK